MELARGNLVSCREKFGFVVVVVAIVVVVVVVVVVAAVVVVVVCPLKAPARSYVYPVAVSGQTIDALPRLDRNSTSSLLSHPVTDTRPTRPSPIEIEVPEGP